MSQLYEQEKSSCEKYDLDLMSIKFELSQSGDDMEEVVKTWKNLEEESAKSEALNQKCIMLQKALQESSDVH